MKLQRKKKQFKRQLKKKCIRKQNVQRLKDAEAYTDAKTKIRCGPKAVNNQYRELKKRCESFNKNSKIYCKTGKCKARNGTCKLYKNKQGGHLCYCEIKNSNIMV